MIKWLLAAVICMLPLQAAAQLRTEIVASGLSRPVAFVPDPFLPNIFFIVEQGGLVKVLRDGQVQAEPFVDLRAMVATGGERGLLGMAFSPDVASGRVFFNYTNTNGDTVIARFRRSLANPLRVEAASQFDLRWPGGERVIRQPFSNHNGGGLAFGTDGYLYIGLGDGGGGNDPENNAQNPAALLGKMLRIDVGVGDGDPAGYRVPADNPFLDGDPIAALGEIWAFGLRNPWRYSFDDLGAGATGALIIADVGQSAREEVNYAPAGAGGRNYGWRLREGRIATPGIPPTTAAYGPLVEPMLDYARSVGQAITGGFVYRGAALGPAYQGRYFVADFVSSRVGSVGLAINPVTGDASVTDVVEHTGELGGSLGGIAAFGRDLQGELYLVTFSGRILKIVPGAACTAPPAPTGFASTVNGTVVTLSWSAGGDATQFSIEAGSTNGAANLAVITVDGASRTLTVQAPPGVYFVRIRGVNACGTGGPSNEIIVSVA